MHIMSQPLAQMPYWAPGAVPVAGHDAGVVLGTSQLQLSAISCDSL